jgi:hypothetical protein
LRGDFMELIHENYKECRKQTVPFWV